MEVVRVLHMNGGMGEASYANNSLVQKKVISMTKPITEEAIINLCYSNSFSTSMVMADLGCSSGPNTLLVVSDLIQVVDKVCRKLGNRLPEYLVYLNDLPGNDFNTIFKSLPSFHESLRGQMGNGFGPCFFTGVPGSFYDRLFPSNSLHFVHSSYSLQWLSKVPEGLVNNKGNIYMARTSPPSVLEAYKEQFQKDFSLFLKCRSEELVAGGRMVLTILGRRSDDPSSKDGCYIWELLAMALNHMVSEGLIEEEKMDSFNIPQYTPSPSEIRFELLKEGSFIINQLVVSQVKWTDANCETNTNDDHDHFDGDDDGYGVAKCMRAVAEPLLFSHFGEAIIDQVFHRYRQIIADRITEENTNFINVIVSVTKRG